MLAVYIATLLCGSCEEVIFLNNSREVDYFKEGPDVCFNHDLINKSESLAKIIDTSNNYNKNLLSNVKNNYQSLESSLNITWETALPIEIPKPNSLSRSIICINISCLIAIFKIPGNIFRPPKLIESPTV
jgi:hypothetical protein